MKKLVLLFLPFVLACNFDNSAKTMESDSEITTYYFIRHAEKDTTNPDDPDPALTPEGVRRSEKWAEVFRDIEFDHIYSTKYKRTTSTAQTVADAQDKEVELYDASKLNDQNFQDRTKGKTVLIVGHSNTNPQFVNYLIGEKKYKDIDDKESGSLFIVTIHPNGTKTSEVLYIN